MLLTVFTILLKHGNWYFHVCLSIHHVVVLFQQKKTYDHVVFIKW